MILDLLRHFVLKEKASSQDFINFWKKQGARIGEGTYFFDPRSNCLGINNPCNLTIGRNVQVTHGVVIVDHGYDWSVLKGAYGDVLGNTGQISIGDNVFIGMNAIILKNVHIGNNVIIGAGSVVTHDIPDDSVAAGNPCRVLMPLSVYKEKRTNAQLEEAVNLFDAYVKTHPGEIPDKELFREYFWLFERPDEEGKVSCAEFDRVMHLVDGSYDLSAKASGESKRLFDSFEDFIKYCQAEKSKE